ncbi:MAG: RNA pseudouridine synthase [Saprospiraceae bacterium]|nr:RNA pseudouridine synthase [Saprospiraceae bacterium]
MNNFSKLNIQVIYEDNHLIAVNKPAGWLVQADETGDLPLSEYVKDYIKRRYNKPGDVFLGTIHRLDRPVSGVVVYARTSKALSRMNKLFQDRQVQKEYVAIVENRPEELEGTLVHYLSKDKERNITTAFNKQKYKSAKECKLHYKYIGGLSDHHILQIMPITGRSHQIRVQLAKIGCSILGDKKYNASHFNNDPGTIHLHAHRLSFIHPVKKEPVVIDACVPEKDQIWQMYVHIVESL